MSRTTLDRILKIETNIEKRKGVFDLTLLMLAVDFLYCPEKTNDAYIRGEAMNERIRRLRADTERKETQIKTIEKQTEALIHKNEKQAKKREKETEEMIRKISWGGYR